MELKIEIGIGKVGQAGIAPKIALEPGGDLNTAATWGELKTACDKAGVTYSDRIYLTASLGQETVLEITRIK